MSEVFWNTDDLKTLELLKNWEIMSFKGDGDFAPVNYAVRCKNCGISFVTSEFSNIPSSCICMRGEKNEID